MPISARYRHCINTLLRSSAYIYNLQVSIKLWATHQSPMRTAMCEDEAMWQARGECWDCCTRTEPQKQWRFWRQQQNLKIKAGDESESHATDIFVRGTWMDVTLQLLRTGRRVSFGLFHWDDSIVLHHKTALNSWSFRVFVHLLAKSIVVASCPPNVCCFH